MATRRTIAYIWESLYSRENSVKPVIFFSAPAVP
jgi:hypothetical protein